SSPVTKAPAEEEEEVQYRLTLVGCLPVHHLTTMAMLPWVVAEIGRPRVSSRRHQAVCLCVSASWVRCVWTEEEVARDRRPWDPLTHTHTVLFECRPHRVTKLLHDSREPCSFGCLVRDTHLCYCYVFQCQDCTKVPEIISTLRQAGKSSARNDDLAAPKPAASSSEDCTPSASFEVLFCGRVTVAHKKAPPALIDECIEKFSQSVGAGGDPKPDSGEVRGGGYGASSGGRPVVFKPDPSFPCLRALDENGLSPEPHTHTAGVQPTSLQENRTMLFMVGRSQVFLVSPDTKTVAIEKSFREISFCSQGIHHVDHFGFICRETVEGGSCTFVCYVFQCTDESLVDEIMLTLKQAFSVAALQQSVRTRSQQCDSCPMQQLHRLCERIEGLLPSKAKLEFQKHLATLDNQEQATVFESTVVLECVCVWDLKHLDTSPLSVSPSFSSLSLSSRDARSQPHGFRRRASTFSHSPSYHDHAPSYPDHTPSYTHTPQVPSGSTKPKLVRHYSVSTDTPHQSNDVAALSSPVAVCVVGDSPLRRHSWRQQIFLRVATPQKNTDSNDWSSLGMLPGGSDLNGRGVSVCGVGDGSLGVVPEERKKRGRAELRQLWRKAILQQTLLLRMERENNKIQASESKRQRLDYEEITPCLKDVTLVWESMLGTQARSKVKFNTDTVHSAVEQGVPRQYRGEVWKFLSEQFVLRQPVPVRSPSDNRPYKELLKQLTSQQHAILIDLGRTFPTHPYFQAQLGSGQLSLYNLLKAYSLLDPEVGYCQGLSFVAGVLLLHMGEEEAFNMLQFLMYHMGLRKQYRPDMIILQIQMYQLSRLLHDYHRDLYVHLEQHEIGPSLYAAPWFLTAFASHFPLGFVARVFDMLFLQGSEVIFKVSLSLLGSHKPLILQHDSLESIVDFIKTTLPNLGLVQMEKTINQVCEMDLSNQLQAYEVEYHVLQDELCDTPAHLNQSQRTAQLERTNQSLRQQNLDLLEELQVNTLTLTKHTHTLTKHTHTHSLNTHTH
uniref:TBC1 domain family member 4 n=1 Tax=Oncorhynchus tshawytscha TaxID=74940 RepID=A0AAZ3R7B3_ONCTS